MTRKSKDVFVKGAAILGIAGLVCKIIGAFYRIALFNILSAPGMAYYEMAYPIYSFLLVVSTAGIPTAISKLVSEKVATDDYRAAHKTFQVAYKALLIIGIVTMIIMFVGAPIYANAYNLSEGMYSLMAIAPSLFFVSVISAYRGYFQGLQMMTPTAVSQLIEQVGKLVVGFGFASYFSKYGLHFGAMGALLGVTISEFAALFVLVIMYNMKKSEIKLRLKGYKTSKKESSKSLLKKIVIIAFPITIGASIMPLAGIVDGYIAMNMLKYAGYAVEEARQLYGIYSGSITSIINMPAIISLSIGISLVPAISGAIASKEKTIAKSTVRIGIKLAIIFGLPCAVGMYIVAEPILNLLYKTLTPYELPIAVNLLQIMSFAVLFLTIVQVMTSIIQGYGKYKIPVITLAIGSIVNIGISAFLVVRPEFNISGVAIGTLACYAVAGLINMAYVFMISEIKFDFIEFIIKPAIANGIMGGFAYFLFPLLEKFIGSSLALLATIGFVAVVYIVCIITLKAIGPNDMEYIPGGRKMKNLFIKMHVWKG